MGILSYGEEVTTGPKQVHGAGISEFSETCGRTTLITLQGPFPRLLSDKPLSASMPKDGRVWWGYFTGLSWSTNAFGEVSSPRCTWALYSAGLPYLFRNEYTRERNTELEAILASAEKITLVMEIKVRYGFWLPKEELILKFK